MAELQELFARLNSQQGTPSPGAPGAGHPGAYRQPSVSSPLFSPPRNGSEPHHASAVMSPNSGPHTPLPEHGNISQPTPQQQSAQLLNLLRFNSSRSASQPSIPPHQRQVQRSSSSTGPSHPVSAASLAANFMGKASQPAPQAAPTTSMPAREHSTSHENPQDLLLRLLNQPKPAQTQSPQASFGFASSPPPPVPETAVDGLARDLANAKLDQAPAASQPGEAANSPMRVFGSNGQPQQSNTFEPEPVSKPIFTYVNPFDQLEAASPRKGTPTGARTAKSPAQKVEILKPKHGLEGSTGSHDGKDQPNRKNRKLSPGPSQPQETVVAEVVANLGPQVNQQVEEALARAESKATTKPEEAAVPESAAAPEKDLADESAATKPAAAVSEPLAEAPKGAASDVAQAPDADVVDNWEEVASTKGDEQMVTVYLLPMQPFASICVDNMPARRATFEPELFMDIARLKKEFDQIDRSLVAATKNFIVYALVKKGGFRIIKQDNGVYRQVFESHQERMFNIAVCDGGLDSPEGIESILAIGVNGSVFWTSLDLSRDNTFSDNLDSHGIVLPSPTQEDNTSGGQLKTRAKPSSRHPEFFAVGRGKSIHIIWPKVAANYIKGGKRVVETEKYLQERSLKITTGKAGKDFTFSEDDTVIVSLDKAGRMRFWDIRPLIDPELGIPGNPPRTVEVNETLLEFTTISPATKSWPTSVFFFDKDKPFSKGLALRYVMVGMKQNHSFQLWDLGLGKAVQEINLPHEKESDAICSAAFHPRTGIMAVAHPTRNSIFFIHVSCPRYNLPPMSQAVYLQRIAENDESQPSLPPVNATAIMTSISEYSFAPKGQIRSIHMLNEPATPSNPDDPESNALFELYVMHSKGVCALRIRRSDLGWKKGDEPLRSKKAKDEGVISVQKLNQQLQSEAESSNGGETPRKTTSERSTRESLKKESSNVSRQSMTPEAAVRASTLAKVESKQDAARAAMMNGGDKPEKKKKKNRANAETASQVSTATRATAASYAQAAQVPAAAKEPIPEAPTAAEPAPTQAAPSKPAASQPASAQTAASQPTPSAPVESDVPEWAKKLFSQYSQPSAAPAAVDFDAGKMGEMLEAQLSARFETLYKHLENDRRTTNANSSARQDALLRMVSTTLNDNVEPVLRKMIEQNTKDILLPKMVEQTSSTLQKTISDNMKSVVAAQLQKEVPGAVSRAMNDAQFKKAFAESVAKQTTANVEPIIASSAGAVINPAVLSLSTLIETKLAEHVRLAELQHRADAEKIVQLTNMVETMQENMRTMAKNQESLIAEVANLRQHHAQTTQPAPRATATPGPSQPRQMTPEEQEAAEIVSLLRENKYEDGTMKWLQSSRTSELFNTVLVNHDPTYLRHVSPLLNLSTGAVVTDDLDHNLRQRLHWLDTVLKNIDPYDPETQEVVPKIMEIMKGRLTQAYIKVNEGSPGDHVLRSISELVNRVNQLQHQLDQD